MVAASENREIAFASLALTFAGAITAFAVTIWFTMDRRIDELQRTADRRCLQLRLLSELHCAAIREVERRSALGVAKTICIHSRFPELYQCSGVRDSSASAGE